MNKIIGNFLASQNNGSFPLDCETLDYLQTNRAMAEMLGAIAGDKIILSGCAVSGNTRSAGYVFLKTTDYPQGEVLYFEGGTGANLCVSKQSIGVTASATPYPNAYTERKLVAGQGTETYAWADFAPLTDKTNRQLRQELTALQTAVNGLSAVPVGCIMMWSGATAPENWHLCDGTHFNSANYPALYAVIGHTYGGYAEDDFCIPDMRGRYVAGKGANDYNSLGAKGGANSVVLTTDEMPVHTHGRGTLNSVGKFPAIDQGKTDKYGGAMYRSANPTENWSSNIKGGGSGDNWGSQIWYQWKDGIEGSLANTGGGQAHENRPPFIVMNYIIKIR